MSQQRNNQKAVRNQPKTKRNNNSNNNNNNNNRKPRSAKKSSNVIIIKNKRSKQPRGARGMSYYNADDLDKIEPRMNNAANGFGPMSDRGASRGYFAVPDAPAYVQRSLDTLFKFDVNNELIVAPAESTSASASSMTQYHYSQTLTNIRGENSMFTCVVLHMCHPVWPFWQSADPSITTFFPNYDNAAVLEGYGDGSWFGLAHDRKSYSTGCLSQYVVAISSDGSREVAAHMLHIRSNGGRITIRLNWDAAEAKAFVWSAATLIFQDFTVAGQDLIADVSAGEFYLWFKPPPGTKLGYTARVWQSQLLDPTPGMSFYGEYILKGSPTTSATYIQSGDKTVRVNSSALLLTNVEPTIYKSGSVNAARILANSGPTSDWQDYLFTLVNTYQGQWKNGGFSPLFSLGAAGDGQYARADTYPVNQFMYPSLAVDMLLINSSLETARSFSTIQVKLKQWLDYQTADAYIAKMEPEYCILWAKIISLANRVTQPTDNPDHIKFMKDVGNAVKWLAFHPDAQKYRDGIKSVGSAALKAIPALAAALL